MTQHQPLFTTRNEVQNWLMAMMQWAKYFDLMLVMWVRKVTL